MSDFSREAMGTCRQHGRFSTDDGGCPSCNYEELTEDPLENCVCDIEEEEVVDKLKEVKYEITML